MTIRNETNSSLCAIYDLGVFPTSFDLAPFLLVAQGEALQNGFSRVRLLLVDGDHQGVRFEGDEYEALYPPEIRNWKVGHILQVLPRLCPMVERTVSIVPREELPLYYARYPKVLTCADYDGLYLNAWRHLDRHRSQIGFRATQAAHIYLQKWMDSECPGADKPLVCVTLRENRSSTDRNSDLAMWAETVTMLHQEGYWPVVVPDTEMAFVERGSEWRAASFCTPAALDLELRMALYERSQLNLFTNSGPTLLAIGSQNCRYLYTGIAYDGTSESSLVRLKQMGVIPGLMPFRSGPYQRWMWEPVTTDLVLQAVAVMMPAITSGTPSIDFPHFAVSFDEDFYLMYSPDAEVALQQGKIRSALEHYVRVGCVQGRGPAADMRPSSATVAAMFTQAVAPTDTLAEAPQPSADQAKFDEEYYLQLYPDVAHAVARGQFSSGRQHFLSFGRREGRFPVPIQAQGVDGCATADEALIVCYDVTIYPESYDFCCFLLAAEAYRLRIGAHSIQMLIMAAPDEGWKFRGMSPEEWQKNLNTTTWWRIQHMVVASANMLTTVRDIRVMTDRAECGLLWQTARYRYPVKEVTHDVPIYQAYREALSELYRGGLTNLLEAPAAAAQYVEQILVTQGLAAKRLIVLTLREAIFSPERNSNLPAWIALADELRSAGYGVIIIPDTDSALTGRSLLDSCNHFVNVLAAFNIYIRMAFYQRAHLNLFANGGPSLLAMLGARTRYLLFVKVLQPTAGTETAFMVNLGLRFGQPTPYPFQRVLDQPDTLENLQREVWALLSEMDADVGEARKEQDVEAASGSNLYDIGMQHYERGELLQAEACFKEAILVATDAVAILTSLGRVCYDQRRYEEAQQYLQEARRQAHGDVCAQVVADRMSQAKKHWGDAAQESRHD